MDDLELAAGSAAGAEEAGWPEGGGFSEPMTYREKRAAEAAEAAGDGEDERHGRGRSRAARYRARIERLEAEVANLRGGSRAGADGLDRRGDARAGRVMNATPRETAAEAAWGRNRIAGGARQQQSGPAGLRSQGAGEAAMQIRAAEAAGRAARAAGAGRSAPRAWGTALPPQATRPAGPVPLAHPGQPYGPGGGRMMAAGGYPGAGFSQGLRGAPGAAAAPAVPRGAAMPFAPGRWPPAVDPRHAAALAAARGQEPSPDGGAHGRPPLGPNGFAPAPAVRGAHREAGPDASRFDPPLRRASDAAVQRHTDLSRAYAAKQDHARTELPDYDRVVGAARMPVSHALAEALVESEHTARLEYHLARSPEKLAELNRLPPREAARAVGRLEAAIAGAAAPRPTRAPAPLTPLRGGAAGPMRSLAELAASENAADYIELRRAQRRA